MDPALQSSKAVTLGRRLFGLVLWLALGVYFIDPVTRVLEPDLDSSIHASYAQFTAQGAQFGPEVNTTAGPYGFVMFGWDYGGELYWERFGLVTVFSLGLAALTLWLFAAAGRGPWRWLWLVAMLLGLTIGDTLYSTAALLCGVYLLATYHRNDRRGPVAAATVLLAFLALTKGTLLAQAGGTLACVLVLALRTRQWRRAVEIIAIFAVALVAWWMAAGQNPLNLVAYVNGLRHIADGYNEAMALETPPAMLRYGLALLGGLGLLIGWTAWRQRGHAAALATTALLAGFVYIMWKHGFLRSDAHMMIFTDFAAVVALTVPVLDRPLGLSPAPLAARLGRALLVALVVGLGIGASQHQFPGRLAMLTRHTGDRWVRNLRYLAWPDLVKGEWDAELERIRRRHDLPDIRARLAGQPADFFGFQFGLLFLNDFRYQPPPMCCGTYHVYNAYFKRRNHEHYVNPATRPRFILFKFQTIDDRLGATDDSLTLLDLLDLYRPVLVENETVLLEALESAAPVEPRPLATRPIRFGEDIEVPEVPADQLLLFSIDVPVSTAGQARALLYKPPLLRLDTWGDGLTLPATHRVVAASLSVPSLLNPTMEVTDDYLALRSGDLAKRVRRFRLHTTDPGSFRSDRMTVTFYTRPRPKAVSLGELRRMRAPSVFRDPPDRVEPESAPVSLYHGHWVQYLHIPTEISYNLKGDERAVTMVVGVDENAYLKGRTDGVDFVMEVESPNYPRVWVANLFLDPLRNPADRGAHRLVGYLPPVLEPGSRLILRTQAAPSRNRAWGWGFASFIGIERGAFRKEQLPGFATFPSAVTGTGIGGLDLGRRRVTMANPPASFEYVLDGTERELRFVGGLLPGSYEGAGNTNGAALVVELIGTDGTTRELFRRLLQPRTVAADRGDQRIVIALPDDTAGARLRLRTDPGPDGQRDWDWVYLAGVSLH
ncbi:MAG TPA: hypothetical protein PLB90_15955 [Opitutaceae bacterium]|nr:hypothetical protein [Opitutaceae bacterium]